MRNALWLRIFVSLLFAVLPPILLLVGVLLLTNSVLSAATPSLVAIVVVIGAVAWAAILAIVFARSLTDGFRSLLALARQGEVDQSTALDEAYRQLGASLHERNRQVAALAGEASRIRINADPRQVAQTLAAAVHSVMRDATWRLAVLTSPDGDLLTPGIYEGDARTVPEPLTDLERWAGAAGSAAAAQYAEGPWGGFTLVNLAVTDELRGVLYAPWEGRTAPSPAEIDFLTLVGQHAGTALEHSLLYARVQSQADELNKLAGVQNDFLRGVTHDLQTPLTSIGALANELRATGGIPTRARSDLEAIAHQADRLRRMVSQLLVASRLEAAAFTPNQEVFAIAPLVERTWAALKANRPFRLSVEGPPNLAVADPDRLEQVYWAVFDNAVKYSAEGTPISVLITSIDGCITTSVTDQGAGMDETARTRAFEQFYRSEQARKMAPDGSGVGLYAARGLVTAMGGWITISSEIGRGTTVTLGVPAESAVDA